MYVCSSLLCRGQQLRCGWLCGWVTVLNTDKERMSPVGCGRRACRGMARRQGHRRLSERCPRSVRESTQGRRKARSRWATRPYAGHCIAQGAPREQPVGTGGARQNIREWKKITPLLQACPEVEQKRT